MKTATVCGSLGISLIARPPPMDGGLKRQGLDRIIQEVVKRGRLERTLPVEEVLTDEAVRDAYREVSSSRVKVKPAFDTAMAVVEKCRF